MAMATEPENRQPEADAGDGRNADRGTNVVLDGSNSSDPDGDELIFAWAFESRPAQSTAELRNVQVATPSFTPDKNGTYVIGADRDRPGRPVGYRHRDDRGGHRQLAAGGRCWRQYQHRAEYHGDVDRHPQRGSGWRGTDVSVDHRFAPQGSSASLSNADRASGADGRRRGRVCGRARGDRYRRAQRHGYRDGERLQRQSAPVARFSVPSEVEVGEAITVDGRNSTDPDGDTLTYRWDVIEAPDYDQSSSDTGGIVEDPVILRRGLYRRVDGRRPGRADDTSDAQLRGRSPSGIIHRRPAT